VPASPASEEPPASPLASGLGLRPLPLGLLDHPAAVAAVGLLPLDLNRLQDLHALLFVVDLDKAVGVSALGALALSAAHVDFFVALSAEVKGFVEVDELLALLAE